MGFLKKMGPGIMDWYGKFGVQGSSEKLRGFQTSTSSSCFISLYIT